MSGFEIVDLKTLETNKQEPLLTIKDAIWAPSYIQPEDLKHFEPGTKVKVWGTVSFIYNDNSKRCCVPKNNEDPFTAYLINWKWRCEGIHKTGWRNFFGDVEPPSFTTTRRIKVCQVTQKLGGCVFECLPQQLENLDLEK